MTDKVILLEEIKEHLNNTTEVLNEAKEVIIRLEKKNLELKKACDETQELLDKQIEATYKLDKENAELKNKYDTCLRENTGLKIHNTYIEKKHTQAKKIIGNLYAICKDNHYPNTSVLMEQAEQFLKESE